MRRTRYNVYAATCPTRQALDRIADKWTALIVGRLAGRPHRFGELLRGIEGISQKMLTQTLRSLEVDGLVARKVRPTVPVTVEYSLTPSGKTLSSPLAAIRTWAETHIEDILAARARSSRRVAHRNSRAAAGPMSQADA
jgi:DNA-binding HxlR family transcriptional regulator